MATISSDIRTNSIPTSTLLSGLARQLVRAGLLDEAAAARALTEAHREETHFVSYLVAQKLAPALDIARVAAQESGLPLFDVSAMDLDQAPIKAVGEKLIRQYLALPLWKRGNRLFLGVADPTHVRALEDIKFQSGLVTEPVVVVVTQLEQMIQKALQTTTEAMQGMLDSDLDGVELVAGEGDDKVLDISQAGDDEAPVVRFVNKALVDAIHRGASDLHFEPYEKIYRVRFRQDGILHEVARPPVSLANRISARLKVMAQMNIAERRVPQDGRMKLYLSKNRAIDFRVNTLPTLWGEKIVMRILDPTSAQLGVEVLGFEDFQKELFMKAIHRPQGMVLVTGPTGSGKTVTLYTALNILNTSEVNISTAEDPVEINLTGINQVNVNVRTGLTFAEALRAFLRQDPDIIMVGEIRDLETAEIAIKAAQTGHMVLSTLHTNSAPETLTRLMNMGVKPFNIATSVTLIIAQRLGRRLCKICKQPAKLPPQALLDAGFREDELDKVEVFRPMGCDQCTNGYKGRVGFYEVMPISKDMERIIMGSGSVLDIADQAKREGVIDLREAGLNKVRLGVTSLEEVNRVTKD